MSDRNFWRPWDPPVFNLNIFGYRSCFGSYDPPHGDYYSKPSQPQYEVITRVAPAEGIIAAGRRFEALQFEERTHALSKPYFFWLGYDAHHNH